MSFIHNINLTLSRGVWERKIKMEVSFGYDYESQMENGRWLFFLGESNWNTDLLFDAAVDFVAQVGQRIVIHVRQRIRIVRVRVGVQVLKFILDIL